ncbi:MAG: sulfatase, partial [Armatimonadetes bacterium]|nr:sulfatase [Armatimonadota bacterium]
MVRVRRRTEVIAVTLRVLIPLALCALVLAGGAVPTGGAPAAPPSFVLILDDDQRADTIQYMPILQRDLVARGVTFTNAFVTTPLCCPSRASLLRGQYAHNTGVLTNGGGDLPEERASRHPGGAEAFDDRSTLATWLHAAGYRTGLFGKYLNGYMRLTARVPPGWDEWHVFAGGYFGYPLNENGVVRRIGNAPEDYGTDVIARRAVQFIERAGTAPLFVYFAPFAPHAPATPHPQDAAGFRDLPPWRPPSYNEGDVSDKPEWVRRLPLLTAARQAEGDEFRRQQLRSLQAVDRAIGQLLEALRRTGRLENTVVVFTADNGLSWGEHRWLDRKSCPYEECVRVPLVVRGPGIPAGRTDPRVVLNVDLAPTFADLAGVRPGLPVDGRSVAPLLRGADAAWRGEILLEYWGLPALTWTAIRTDRWKYVEYENGDRELYDLAADPFEMTNVIGSSPATQVVPD